VITSEIRDKDAIVNSIKDFLGKGKVDEQVRPQDDPAAVPAGGAETASRRSPRSTASTSSHVIFEMLSYDQMNEIAAYGGFPNRYPHWRFGMEYEQL
jgi:hypothetical protein